MRQKKSERAGPAWKSLLHAMLKSDPRTLPQLLEATIREEWPEFASTSRDERRGALRELRTLMQDEEAYGRVLGCVGEWVLEARNARKNEDDFDAQIEISKRIRNDVRQAERALDRVLELGAIQRSERLVEQARALHVAIRKTILEEPRGAEAGKWRVFLLQSRHEDPGRVARMLREQRLEGIDWDLARVIAAGNPGRRTKTGKDYHGKRRGRKGLPRVSDYIVVAERILLHTMQSRNTPITLYRVRKIMGGLLRAFLPEGFRGATSVKGIRTRERDAHRRDGITRPKAQPAPPRTRVEKRIVGPRISPPFTP